MLDGRLLVDAHVHVARLPTLSRRLAGLGRHLRRRHPDRPALRRRRRAGARRAGRALRRRGRRPRAAVHRVQPEVDRHPADRGRAAAGRAQPGPVPPGRQHQPAPALSGEGRAGAPGRPRRRGLQDPSGARRLRARRPDALPRLLLVRGTGYSGHRALRHLDVLRVGQRLRRAGPARPGLPRLPRPDRRARPRRPRLVVRPGGVPGADAAERLARGVRAAAGAAARLLRRGRWPGWPPRWCSGPTGRACPACSATPARWRRCCGEAGASAGPGRAGARRQRGADLPAGPQ